MHKCEMCGHEMGGAQTSPSFTAEDHDEDSELKAKDSVLAELMDLVEGGLSSKLKEKKPSSVSVEMVSMKPKKKDDEEEV